MGWSGIENGELLRRAANAGFDALITNDRGLEYEQNPESIPIAVLVLIAKANTIQDLRLLLASLQASLDKLSPRTVVRVTV
jgi:hypothetical protein